MLYSICIGLILVASILLILVVLVQSPKSGMAANFGAANQVMGVRDSANALEKMTWWLAGIIVVLSLVATVSMESEMTSGSNAIQQDANALIEKINTEAAAMPQAEIPAEAETAVEE
ncbi:MAG: preprotein translocase subunit SecG [Alistipes sp.]|nr:preprotein translocase subunit SecG [Alistipes sp.]